jgi:periplasmic protein TonB
MTGFRVILGVAASVGLHVGTLVALNRPTPPKEHKQKPAVIELAALPPLPKPEPPKEPPPPEPEEQKPEPKRPTKLMPAAAPPKPEAQRVPPTSTPLVLAGLSMSNAGISVPSGYGASPAAPARRSTTSEPKQVATLAPVAPTITPVSDLSKRPVPPQLDSALARFYPVSLRSQGVEGEALIRVVLAEDGRVAQTSTVSESHSGFAPACERALRTSRWEPPIDKAGNPTMTALKYRCRFRVNL